MKPGICLLTLLLMIAGGGLFARNAGEGSLSGFVYDAGNREGLIGVNVYLPEPALGAGTNTSGYYIIPRIPPGEYTLIAEYIGYQPVKHRIVITENTDQKLNLTMTMALIEGQVVEVVADSLRVSERLFEKPLSNVQLSPRQINAIPQVAETDLLRSLQTLPGILPVSDYSSALYVRGGTPDQNLYLLDGTDVYNPEHAFGIFSTFNTDAIKHIEISKGGFGAAYGGRLSSILDVINLDGNRRHFEGTASISLLSAKTTLQMPIGKIGALSGSIRRTYFDKTVGPAIDEIPDYYFYDGNIKAFFDLDAKNKITLSGYGGRDVLHFVFNPDTEDDAGFDFDWGNRTGSIRWTRVFNPQLFANFWVTGSRFTSDFDLGETIPVVERNLVTDVTLKGNLEYHYSRHWLAKFGFEQKNLHTLFRQTFPEGSVDVDQEARQYSGYVQSNWRPTDRWDIETGVRYNLFESAKNYQDWEPRIAAKFRLTETVNLRAAAGIYHQYLHRIQRSFVTDIWTVSNAYQAQSESQHVVFGIQKEIARDYQLEVEGYYKLYDNIYQYDPNFLVGYTTDRFDDNGDPVYTHTEGLFNSGDGESWGFELLLRKDIGALTGWIGYAFASTEYAFPDINNGNAFAPRHDRRSTVNMVGNINIRNFIRTLKGRAHRDDSGRWRLGINLVYASGQPITMPGSAYLVGDAPFDPSKGVTYYPSEINSLRLPAYARLDISLNYLKRYKNWSMEPYLQIYNIGNRKNVWFIDYDYVNGLSDVDEVNMFPLLPTVGINFKF